ncbi:O-antigen ligase family protein [Candidatus Curtissbacteria bacterium]|nr:O-antigen ligase family protein [Candidatus Curtissbacteria bacterium]
MPGYIVRLRLDDVLVAVAFAVWVVQLIRKKVSLRNNPLLVPMIVYVAVGALSSLSAIFVTKTVPLSFPHLEKLFFNWARRIEYFSVFFVFASTIKSLNQVKKYVYVTAAVLLLVSIYGFGQKYLYWPAYSTMNREFSKGVTLYLTEHARVLSTFGGHYDLAAYLMMLLTLFIPLSLIVKKWFQKLLLILISACAFWLLILTVSRTSFIAYLFAITVAFGLLIYKKGYFWAISRYALVLVLSLFVMLSFGDLSDRFSHLLKLDKLKTMGFLKPIAKEAPKGPNVAYIDITNDNVGSKSDTPPTTAKPSVPVDVYNNVPEYGSASGLPASMAAKPRVYSQAAVTYDLSTGIRLDYTWPQAIKGFLKNPLLGSGYSTLTKKNIQDFTEAESTDNDFLRALGETGLLGFLAFFGLIGFIIWKGIRAIKDISDPFHYTVAASLVAATLGLLLNAVYIDVFEASKVAYVFWILVAILLSIVKFAEAKSTRK